MAEFEYDQSKSKSNLDKHGISFEDAKAIWDDPNLLEIRAKSEDESRFLVIGMIESKHWSAIINYRNQRVRLISVRRARKSEVKLYES